MAAGFEPPARPTALRQLLDEWQFGQAVDMLRDADFDYTQLADTDADGNTVLHLLLGGRLLPPGSPIDCTLLEAMLRQTVVSCSRNGIARGILP